jgi:hypothetical protein
MILLSALAAYTAVLWLGLRELDRIIPVADGEWDA